MLIIVFTGIAAGALHVVGGVDHLVAMTPIALRKPRVAINNGLAWGFGHSAGVLVLSIVAILIKDIAHIEKMSSLAEFLVGISLIVVGALAIRNSFGLNIHAHRHKHGDGYDHDHIHLHVLGSKKHLTHTHASTGLGVLHGLAGASHILAILPALALPPFAAFIYLAAYLVTSIATMGAVLGAISFASLKAGNRFLPLLFCLFGFISFFTGLIWIQKTSLQLI